MFNPRKRKYNPDDVEASKKRTKSEKSTRRNEEGPSKSSATDRFKKLGSALKRTVQSAATFASKHQHQQSDIQSDSYKQWKDHKPVDKNLNSLVTNPQSGKSNYHKFSVNDRLKRQPKKPSVKYEEKKEKEVIIIEDSPRKEQAKSIATTDIQKRLKNRGNVNETQNKSQIENVDQKLSDSFIVVSDADDSFISHKSINDRLKRSRPSYLSNNSGPETDITKNECVKNLTGSPSSNRILTEPYQINTKSLQKIQELDKDEAETKTEIAKSYSPQCPEQPKPVLVENWIDSIVPKTCNDSGNELSESLIVHANNTLLGSSILMTELREDNSMDWDTYPEPSKIGTPPKVFPADVVTKLDNICIVTDTNVFMHNLSELEELLKCKVTGDQKLIIYVPWMVFKELDHLKDNGFYTQKSRALSAQKFINKKLLDANPKVVGQSVQEVCQQQDIGKDPDDKILACCFQVKNKFTCVILLSNDVNLRNKALTNDVTTYTPKELLAKLKSTTFVKVKVRLQGVLSQIIAHACKETYGNMYNKMEMLQGCPWSFEGCLQRLKQYWSTVFRSLLLKQCLKTIEELITVTTQGEVADADSEKFKSLVSELLFYLGDIEEFSQTLKKLRDEVIKI